jgi:glutamine amidotransferase
MGNHVFGLDRKATQGRIELENTHPFHRELWGRNWIFAHNGNLEHFAPARGQYYRPVGDTDSEAAFCHLLETLRQRFAEPPPLAELTAAVRELAASIRAHGVFNFMLSNGDVLFTHCSTHLHYLVRQAPFSVAHLVDNDVSIDFAEVTTPSDRVAVIATQPLTDNETWTAHPKDTVLVFHEGAPLALPAAAPCPASALGA